jgi:hypothetical protein
LVRLERGVSYSSAKRCKWVHIGCKTWQNIGTPKKFDSNDFSYLRQTQTIRPSAPLRQAATVRWLFYVVPRARSVPPVAGLPVKIASCIGVLEFMKSQTPSIKLQTNLKFQSQMTKILGFRFQCSGFSTFTLIP